MADPLTLPLPQHTPDPQDLKGDRQQNVQESRNVVSILHPHLQTDRHDGDILSSALGQLKGTGGPGLTLRAEWADTDLTPRHIDSISLALAKTCGGPVRGPKMGPEPTLLTAVDGKIENAGSREKNEVGVGGLRRVNPPDNPTHSY